MVVREVFEVLYSPVNAFKKIIEKPDFKGVLIILLLLIASSVAVQYVVSSRRLLENRTPKYDDWTEVLTNQHVWTSTGSLSLDATDYQMGNNSISSSGITETSIWLRLTDIGSINCSEATGYTELFFWINWTSDAESFPSSGTLKLFSGSDSYFESDITDLLASSGEWTNITLKVGPDQGWTSSNSPDWQSITGIEFRLDFSSSANLTMNIDGVSFRIFLSSIEMGTFGQEILYAILQVGMSWILWAGIILIVAKLFQEELGQWTKVFIIIGYVFMATVVSNILSAGLISTLPTLNYLLDATGTYYYPMNPELWLSSMSYQLLTPILWIGEIWLTGLTAVAVHGMKEIVWRKAVIIVAVAFGINFFLRPLLSFFVGF